MKRLILALTFGAFAAGSASAQLRLTLDDAIQMALSENPTIKVADLDVERYDYVKKETRGNLLPSLSASGEYTRAIEKSTMRGGISFGADNTFTGTASLSVPLFAPAVYRTLKLNRTQIASAVEAARSSRITLVAEVKKAFYNILLAEQSLATLEESRATIQRTVDDTKVKFEQGVASEYDYLTAQVELSNLLPTITQTKNSIRVAMLQLKMYLSVPEALSIELVGNLDEMKDVVLAGGETLSTDVSRNSDLRALDIQAEMLRYQLKTTNAARIPTVAAFGSATITGNDMEDFRKMVSGGAEAGTGEAVADLNSSKYFWTHPISVGVQISIPIFSGLKNSYKSREESDRAARFAARLCAAPDDGRRGVGDQQPADGARDDAGAGADDGTGRQSLPHLRHAVPCGRRHDSRTQFGTAQPYAGAFKLFAGDLRLPLRAGRLRSDRRQGGRRKLTVRKLKIRI